MKQLLFSGILLYASAVDARCQIVPNHVLILLFITGMIHAGMYSLQGLALAFLPLYTAALLSPSLGGGDVKFAALCGFVMGMPVLYALLIGLTIFLIGHPLYCRFRQKPIKGTSLPLVPFLAFGCLIISISQRSFL